MRASLARLLEARPALRPDFIALPEVPWEGPGGVDIAREFFDYVSDPALLDVVEQIIGPDIVLRASGPRATVTVWIARDDVSVDNGCMRAIPGSHRLGEFSHEVSEREDLVLNNVLNDARINLDQARNIELQAGLPARRRTGAWLASQHLGPPPRRLCDSLHALDFAL